ncbi:hypothetical protein AKJ35_01175 [candidate division MSBL1 archaeon SCGC-AAA833F18]|uniref:Amidohydrolase-related domain-containing protein n=1 Tax=candidate division MSBL1 archaeon SCGC-AAA833F18 TaxID=1698257 RepID=A0A133VS19_9EURY|nr:hypothetical protein AKJ35_01175 [candidate division MSBL1 archaeon SCGC-AAA833F18]
MSDLTIRNAKLFLPTGVFQGGLAVEDGIIIDISKSGLPKSDREFDAEGKLVIPGVIDSHAHLYDPEYSHREDFESGSRAAAAGGVTFTVLMPLDTPMFSPEDLKHTISVGEKNSLIDFGLHAGNMNEKSIKYIEPDIELGVRSFKLFTSPPYALDMVTRRNLMKNIDEFGGISFIHAEDEEILTNKIEELKKAGRSDPLAHAESRPNEAEEKAVREVVADAKELNCRLHLAHITTRQGVEIVRKAKEEQEKLTAETCPHYLIFTKEDVKEKGPYLRINPAPKTKKDIAAVWKALSEDVIDTVATDHAPGTQEEKEVGWEDVWSAQIGIPGIETLLPLMLSEGLAKKRLTLERLVNSLCTNPAKAFGFYPQKGVIQEGADADLVMIDKKKHWEIQAEDMHYKVGWTPYEGMKLEGKPVMTISRGEVISENGKIKGKPGRGRFIPSEG